MRDVPTPQPPPPGLNQDQQDLWNIFEKYKIIALQKNADYGSSVFTAPPLAPQVPPSQAILVRMGDKIKRLQNLLGGAKQHVKDESIDDTLADLATYAFLALIARRRERGGKE